MKVLHLTLKKKWFDMIASGEKTEEYREIKPYWQSRLQVNGYHRFEFKKFDIVRLVNGYSKNAPFVTFFMNEIRITTGFRDWGAEPGKKYFVIKLGERIL